MTRALAVLVPYPIDKAYDYLISPGMDPPEIGAFVCVPLGGREVTGVVWGPAAGDVKPEKLKALISQYDLPPMPKVQRDFIDWVAAYTLTPKGFVLKMSLSAPAGLNPPKPEIAYRLAAKTPLSGASKSRQKILEALADGRPRRAAEIGVSASILKAMAATAHVESIEIFPPAPCSAPQIKIAATLSPVQENAAQALRAAVTAPIFSATLLDGVTGAGKTEVYFEAVAQALEQDKQTLILLPEIALSNAFLDRFKARFGCAPALWHSQITPAQRRGIWRGVARGETRVVVGARSALFLPYQDLGLIIVDEEHDPAYKQEDGVIYHARDMAVVRAHLGKFPVVLVSATPSLETMQNVWEGKYRHLELSARFGGAQLPTIKIVDLRADKPERQAFLSKTLIMAVQETVEAGEQALLFLNRRGYAPLTLCRTCGHRFECPRCTAWLVEHKKTGKLQCHHCGFNTVIPKTCPSCGDAESLAACGPGVERIEEEVRSLFPQARVIVLASDTAESNDDLKAMLRRIREGDVDIIIGTQIIAKGHHFPNLTLVGVVDADLGLNGGDLRAAERTYQLLHQVAGRAGREKKAGRVILQSWMPEHRIMQAMAGQGRDDFLRVEAAEREAAHMPPFSRLEGIIVAGRDEGQVLEVARALGRSSPQGLNEKGQRIQTLGPAPAPLARLRGKYRQRLLVRADKALNLQRAVSEWVAGLKIPASVRVYIDIDPQGFL